MAERRAIWLLGVCHRRAPVTVREQVAYAASDLRAVLERVRERLPGVEAFVLSTCNRTEAYLAGPADRDVPAEFATVHPQLDGGRDRIALLRRHERRGDHAVAHLVRVACGLESAVLGEAQVLAQVRAAVGAASEAGTLGPYLSRASAIALRAGSRARRETSFGRGAGAHHAIAQLVVEHAQRSVQAPTRVMLLGAGGFGSALAHSLARSQGLALVIASPSSTRSRQLASRTGASPVEWSAWRSELARTDVLVCATAAQQPIVHAGDLDAARASGRLSLVIDAAVPRNVAAGPEHDVVTIDDVSGVEETLRSAIPAIEHIVRTSVVEWHTWCATRWIDELAKDLYDGAAAAARAIAADVARAGLLDAGSCERLARAHVRKLLDRHVRALRAAAPPPPFEANIPFEPFERVGRPGARIGRSADLPDHPMTVTIPQ